MLNQPKNYDQYLIQHVTKDLDQRTIHGSYVYSIAWALIGGGTGFYKAEPLFFWVVLIVLLAAGLFRLLCHFYFNKHPQVSNQKRSYLLFINILLPTSIYSCIFSLTLFSEPFKPLFFYILMTVFALLSSATSIFAPRKELSITFIAVLTIPPFFAAIMAEDSKMLEAMLLALYSLYMLVQANRLSQEYMTLIKQQFQLKQLNQQDGLTGIANRRCFDLTLVHFWRSHIRTQSRLSLMIIDIDHFKQVNDNYGHTAGDEVIIEVANILNAKCRRETDLVARIGGEEFAVLIAINKFEEIKDVAEELRRKIEKTTFEHDGQLINVTISIGIATTVPEVDNHTADFYKTADQCLYRAKENGRNRIEYQVYEN